MSLVIERNFFTVYIQRFDDFIRFAFSLVFFTLKGLSNEIDLENVNES